MSAHFDVPDFEDETGQGEAAAAAAAEESHPQSAVDAMAALPMDDSVRSLLEQELAQALAGTDASTDAEEGERKAALSALAEPTAAGDETAAPKDDAPAVAATAAAASAAAAKPSYAAAAGAAGKGGAGSKAVGAVAGASVSAGKASDVLYQKPADGRYDRLLPLCFVCKTRHNFGDCLAGGSDD